VNPNLAELNLEPCAGVVPFVSLAALLVHSTP
jgi:hypothetical protein